MPPSPGLPRGHRIRLRGPWEFCWVKPAGRRDQPAGEIRLPSRWKDAFGDARGTVRLSRKFNGPTGIEPGDRIWLEVAAGGEAGVLLNGDWLGHVGPGVIARFDVSNRIALHNRTELDLSREEAAASEVPIAEVALVIEPAVV